MVDADDRIKLIDFGIASKAGARRLTFGKLSKTQGTPEYISPEQIKGKRGDARSVISSRAGMISAAIFRGGGASECVLALRIRKGSDPPNGVSPASISYKMTPTE